MAHSSLGFALSSDNRTQCRHRWGCSGQQALGASWLHGGAAVGAAQAMAVAVIPNRLIHHLLPAAQVVSFLGLEGTAFVGVGSAGFPPTQPVAAEGMHEEIEQTGEADAHDRIPFAALAVALNLEAVVEQACHRQGCSPEGIGLSLLVAGIDLVEMNFRQVIPSPVELPTPK